MTTRSRANAAKGKKPPAAKKLAGKTLAFVGKFGYHGAMRGRYVGYAVAEGGTVVGVDSAVPDYLVIGEGRGGNPPSVVAKVQKKHPGVQVLDLADFCRLLMPSRDELLAELRSGAREDRHNLWDERADMFRQCGTPIDLTGADLRKTDLRGANLTIATLDGSDLRGASAHYTRFGDLRGVKFDGADLSHAYFFNAEACSFRKAALTDAWFSYEGPRRYERCDFTDAKLGKIDMDDSTFVGCTFAGADLSDAEIERADFSGTNLERADLSRAHGSESKFDGANLTRAVLFRADLRGASLVKADLRRADLREAVLSGADLTGARIDGADFAAAALDGAKIAGLDAARAKNFQAPAVRQAGPKLRELAQIAAAATKRFVTSAEADLGKGEHATLTLWADARNNRHYFGADSRYRRDDNQFFDRIDAPTFEQGMMNLAARWPSATLRLDTITSKGSQSPRGKQLLDLATAAWAEAFGLEAAAPDALQRQKAEQQAAVQKLREAMLNELKGGPAGVKKWNARSVHERDQIGPLHGLDLKEAKLAGVRLKDRELQNSRFEGADLRKADLWMSKLQGADFARADLTGASLHATFCPGATFEDARLGGCDMEFATLKNATFRGADLTGANLDFAHLEGADLSAARLDGADFGRAHYDADTKFPAGFTPPETMQRLGPPPGIDVSKTAAPGSMDFDSFFQQLGYKVESDRLAKAVAMLKAERFQLFTEVKGDALVGVVKSQSDPNLVYSCRLTSGGKFGCCTQNLKPCGGLRGALCKHLLVLVVGLTRSGRLDPATTDAWVLASKKERPEIDKDAMSETFIRYKGAEAGTVDWRPTETIPEDYYSL